MTNEAQGAKRRVSDDIIQAMIHPGSNHLTEYTFYPSDLALDLSDERAVHAETQRERDALKAALAALVEALRYVPTGDGTRLDVLEVYDTHPALTAAREVLR